MKAAPKSQRAMYDEASRKLAEIHETFLEMLPTMRRKDLERLIKKRPALWGRFAGYLTSGHVFVDDLPSKVLHHATRKSSAQLDREIAEWQAARSGLSKHQLDLLSRRKPGGGLRAGYLTPTGWHGDPMVIEDRKLRLEALREQPAPRFPKDPGRRSHATIDAPKIPVFKISTKAPASMTAAEINKELDKLGEQDSALGRLMIEGGRGYELPSEYLKLTDPLSMGLRKNSNRRQDLRIEISFRYGPNPPSRLPTGRGFGPRSKTKAEARRSA
jgi:hypothetical protein